MPCHIHRRRAASLLEINKELNKEMIQHQVVTVDVEHDSKSQRQTM